MSRTLSKRLALALAYLVLFAPLTGYSQQTAQEVLLRKDLKLSVELLSPLSTASNKKEDVFSCKVLAPAEYAGALVSGHVRKAKRSGKEKGKSEMDLAFDTLTLPDGRTGNLSATVLEVFDVVDAAQQGRADNEGTIKAKSTVKRDAVKIGAGAAIGAIIGGLIGGGHGAVAGAAIGAALAATTTLVARGPDLEFKQGTQFTIQTNAPVRSGSAKSDGGKGADSPPPPESKPPRQIPPQRRRPGQVSNPSC